MAGRSFHLGAATAFHPGIDPLRAEAAREGFGFLDRLVSDWARGLNRFDRPGERFVGAFSQGELIGVCGLNRDPYVTGGEAVGRLRHLYVRKADRRTGVASTLVARLLTEARATFGLVRLRAASPDAAAFYVDQGFAPVTDDTASHVKALP